MPHVVYKMGFEDIEPGTCEATHVQPFSTDLHLFGLQCKQSAWLIAVLVVTFGIKLFQNWLYTKIGQLQRELLQIDRNDRSWNTPKVLSLLWWEFVAGVIGIISVLVITGNNAIIWLTIILSNCAGTWYAYTHVEADHHSTALELVNMLEKRGGTGLEAIRARKAIEELRSALQGDPVELQVKEEQALVRKRLFL